MSDYFDRVERQIVQRVEAGVPRPSRPRVASGHLAVAAAVLVVIVVAGVFLAARGSGGGAPASHPARSLVFTAHPAGPRAIDQSVRLLRERLGAVVPGAGVAPSAHGVIVTLSHDTADARKRVLALAAPGRLAFYDWEADALLPSGKTVASRLRANDPAALEISQGSGGTAPGGTSAGCMTLQQALALTGKLGRGEPRRTERVGGLAISVPIGFVVVQATDAVSPVSAVYVLRDRTPLTNGAIVNPRQEADPRTGTPMVGIGFTAVGERAFHGLTATIARRGILVSGFGETLNQHFAIALDNRLIAVPSIDYKQYPDGINGDRGADIAGNLTAQEAKDLAILLRYGPLPLNLTAAG
jgi:hypothetical protein